MEKEQDREIRNSDSSDFAVSSRMKIYSVEHLTEKVKF